MCVNTVKYWSESSFETEEWPCCCTEPAHAYENSSWECSHGRWLVVPDAAAAEKQAQDILSGGSMDLHVANSLGLLWGDIVCAWEEQNLKMETPEQTAARLARKLKEVEESQKSLVDFHVHKFKDIYCDRQGELKKRQLRTCKWFCGCSCDRGDCTNNGGRARLLSSCKKVVGKAFPGGKGWAPGCQAHLKHACPFIHPDEPEWKEIISGSRPSSATGGRDFTALKARPHHY